MLKASTVIFVVKTSTVIFVVKTTTVIFVVKASTVISLVKANTVVFIVKASTVVFVVKASTVVFLGSNYIHRMILTREVGTELCQMTWWEEEDIIFYFLQIWKNDCAPRIRKQLLPLIKSCHIRKTNRHNEKESFALIGTFCRTNNKKSFWP